MIVEPDFLDHWKTRQLVEVTADPASPLLVLRLWAHCQHRKTSRFPGLTDAALSAICRWKQKPEQLRAILIETGFITYENGSIVVHDWEVTNRILVSAWTNGRFGGRPRKKKPTGIPTGKPVDHITLSSLSSSSLEGDSKRKPKADSLDEVRSFAQTESITDKDAEWFFFKCEANGWTNAGRAIKNWQMTLRSWHRAGYLPSQKTPQTQARLRDPKEEKLERMMREAREKVDHK
jgi:hypothetical protein